MFLSSHVFFSASRSKYAYELFLPVDNKRIHSKVFRSCVQNKFRKTLRMKLRGQWSATSGESWSSERLVAVHGAVLGLTAFVKSAPYTVPPYLPDVVCTLAGYLNLPQPIAVSQYSDTKHKIPLMLIFNPLHLYEYYFYISLFYQ